MGVLNHITFLFLFFFLISTAAIIVIPITSVIHHILCIPFHSPTITIIIVVNVVNVIVLIVRININIEGGFFVFMKGFKEKSI